MSFRLDVPVTLLARTAWPIADRAQQHAIADVLFPEFMLVPMCSTIFDRFLSFLRGVLGMASGKFLVLMAAPFPSTTLPRILTFVGSFVAVFFSSACPTFRSPYPDHVSCIGLRTLAEVRLLSYTPLSKILRLFPLNATP